MRRAGLIIFVLVFWLATCKAPEPKTPVVIPTPTNFPPTDTAVAPTPTETAAPEPKLPAAPFESQVYFNEDAGFALDIPAGWTIQETVVRPRGTEILFVSKADLAEAASMPPGETRLTATLYQWDPKNDLEAYVNQRKSAWEASGFTILDEQQLILEQGLPAVQFTVRTAETEVIFLVTALNDQYLVLAGEGDLNLVGQIVQRLRPVS